jgi:hypothetical protein
MPEEHHEHPLHHGVGEALGFLAHKIGPFPVWVYLAGIAGGLGAAWWINRRSGSAAAPSAVDNSGGGTSSPASDSSGALSAIQGELDTLNQQQQQQNQQFSSALDTLNQQQQQQNQQFSSVIQSQNQQFSSALDSLSQGFQQSLGQMQSTINNLESSFANWQNTILTQRVQMVQVPQVGGGTVNVPAAVAAAGSRSGSYVAGTQPATWSNPAGGGTWNGQTDTQIQQNFIAAAGGDVAKAQAMWQAQHAAEVAANGG